MITQEGKFLKTGLSQVKTNEILVEKLQSSIEFFTYNIRRYHVDVSLVLLYTEEDVNAKIQSCMRLTDIIDTVKIGESYFNFIFLPFTNEQESYDFIKKVEINKLQSIKSFFYFRHLTPTTCDYFNFINSYLFEIKKEETFF